MPGCSAVVFWRFYRFRQINQFHAFILFKSAKAHYDNKWVRRICVRAMKTYCFARDSRAPIIVKPDEDKCQWTLAQTQRAITPLVSIHNDLHWCCLHPQFQFEWRSQASFAVLRLALMATQQSFVLPSVPIWCPNWITVSMIVLDGRWHPENIKIWHSCFDEV